MLEQCRVYAALPAADLDRAKRFYDEKLGLTSQELHGIATQPGGDRAAWFKDSEGNMPALVQFG